VPSPQPARPDCLPQITRPRTRLFLDDEVLALRGESADVTTTKTSFFERQPLVTVEGAPSGNRTFRQNDVTRLRFVERKHGERFPAPEGGPL
jgi:DNA-binding transcriptional MerR regulator